jgi:DNA-binding Lrp family transcriptional regulator
MESSRRVHDQGGEKMQIAYILINTQPGSGATVLRDLKKIKEVKDAYLVYGVYDIVVKINADSMDRLREIVASRIRSVGDVRSTLTMAVVQPQ